MVSLGKHRVSPEHLDIGETKVFRSDKNIFKGYRNQFTGAPTHQIWTNLLNHDTKTGEGNY